MTRNEYVAVAVATMSAARGAVAPLWYFCLPGSWDLKPSASLSMTSGVLSPPLGRRLPKKSRNDCRRPTGRVMVLPVAWSVLTMQQTQAPHAGCFPSGCCNPTRPCHPRVASLRKSDAADPEECLPRCQWCRTPEFGGEKKVTI